MLEETEPEVEENADELAQNWATIKAYFSKPLDLLKFMKQSAILIKLKKISEENVEMAEELLAQATIPEDQSSLVVQAAIDLYNYQIAFINFYNATHNREPINPKDESRKTSTSEVLESISRSKSKLSEGQLNSVNSSKKQSRAVSKVNSAG